MTSLLEYLQTVYHLGRARWALDRLGALDFVTTIAPGLRDVFLTGKVCQALDARLFDGARYDAVVVDAPPTGRVARFLNVNEQVAGLARVGPVRNQADSIMKVLRSAQTTVHVVTLLEEMPTQETVDVVADLGGIGLPVGGVLINMVRTPILTAGDRIQAQNRQLPRAEIASGLAAAGLPTSAAVLDALIGEVLDATDRSPWRKPSAPPWHRWAGPPTNCPGWLRASTSAGCMSLRPPSRIRASGWVGRDLDTHRNA